MISCIIIDDEPLAVQLLEDHALKTGLLNIVYAGTDVFRAIEVLNSQQVDLVFIDLQMPEMTGMELMQLFSSRHSFIITSAYPEYALDAFRFRVIDFMLKPVTFKRFYQGVEKFINWHGNITHGRQADYLFVRADRKHYQIRFADILYIEGLKDYIRIHHKSEVLTVWENMKDILNKLPAGEFIRVHRSYIVSRSLIRLVEGNQILMQNGQYIPIGETYRKEIASWLEIR